MARSSTGADVADYGTDSDELSLDSSYASLPSLVNRENSFSSGSQDDSPVGSESDVESPWDDASSSDDDTACLMPLPREPNGNNNGKVTVDYVELLLEGLSDEQRNAVNLRLERDSQFSDATESMLRQLSMDANSWRQKSGDTLLHLIACNNEEFECFEWLVKQKGLDPDATNSRGETALDIVLRQTDSSSHNEIREKFQYLRRWYKIASGVEKEKQTILREDMAIKIQTLYRGFSAKKELELRREARRVEQRQTSMAIKIQLMGRRYLGRKKLKLLRETCEYTACNNLIYYVMDLETSGKPIPNNVAWTELKRKLDMVVQDELDLIGDAALEASVAEDERSEVVCDLKVAEPVERSHHQVVPVDDRPEILSVQVTPDVIRWVRQQKDEKSKQLFTNRLTQLAKGDDSKCLCKRLKGSKRIVFEAKLDAGQRIIYTRQKDEILVWFVCKHDRINWCLKRVNHSYERVITREDKVEGKEHFSGIEFGVSSREIDTETLEVDREPEMLVSPFSNTPLKIHSLGTNEIDNFVTNSDWTPPVKLTKQEEEIVKKKGTVLVLGRSGTGKTLCVCSRIDRDRQMLGPQARQLFLSRTKRLCGFVKGLSSRSTTMDENIEFRRVDDWVGELGKECGCRDEGHWQGTNHMTYGKFCDKFDMFQGDEKDLDVLQVWTQIRSFIKGSFEAAKNHRPLTETEYVMELSKDRCRLDQDTRRKAYKVFKQYQLEMDKNAWWDDMDRVSEVVRLLLERTSMYAEPLYDRIYVDEVQDITQAEIGLCFLASGLRIDSLFLAGDPAQAVSQGVDFRFEEVRSVVHMITEGKQKIERWQKLYQNFRSHQGILSVAEVVLNCLHSGFPSAAIKLSPDTGLVQGPRPGLLTANLEEISRLLRSNEKIRVLVRDGFKSEFRLFENACYGIIEAKGLEFSDVLIVDFFSRAEKKLAKAWKDLLADHIAQRPSVQKFPQALELELKLLYTAITRTQNRLLFVETEKSEAYSKWCRLLKKRGLAETMEFDEIMKDGTKLMTADEWRVEGIEMALQAEEFDNDSFASASDLLNHSIAHFQKAGDSKLEARVRAQLMAMKLEHAARSSEDACDGTKAVIAYLEAGLVGEAVRVCNDFCCPAGLTGLAGRIDKLVRVSDGSTGAASSGGKLSG